MYVFETREIVCTYTISRFIYMCAVYTCTIHTVRDPSETLVYNMYS